MMERGHAPLSGMSLTRSNSHLDLSTRAGVC